jgi:hypothetical protein
MPKRSFVQIDGQMYEKTGDNSAIINGETWYRIAGRWAPAGSVSDAPMVMPDLQPYRSPLDGSIVSSRSSHRAHMREHGVIEVGNERPKPRPPQWTMAEGLRQELITRINS